MASARLYRDYISSEEPRDLPPRRSPSGRTRSSAPASPRTVISDLQPTQGRTGRLRGETGLPGTPEHEHVDEFLSNRVIGTARTTSSDRIITALPQYGPRIVGFPAIGIASTTDSRRSSLGADGTATMTTENTSVTSYDDDEAREPVLNNMQADIPPANSPMAPRFGGFVNKSGMASSANSATDSMSPMPRDRMSGRSNSSRMPEFFGQSVFQTVLHNPAISHQLLKFGQSRLCGENMEFLARVTRYTALLEEASKAIYEIHKDFISTSAPAQINLPEHLLVKVNSQMKTSLTTTVPMLESVFVDAQADIERLVYTDIYPNFVRHQMSVSAAKALGTDRSKYAGLGDCFVLTDPSKADNPIMYATDGFVKVSGYQRNEIIPRNCRFLQSKHTDRAAVRRLKAAIDKREESVELLLNVKKNGEPFWNLLYVTPLYDAHGNLAFFLGGQINCSTTIHSASDVLKILGASHEPMEEAVPGMMSPPLPSPLSKPPRARSFFNAIRGNPRATLQPAATPGMENKLIDKLEDLSLKNQMETFHTAYSNARTHPPPPTTPFIIINYSSYLISFISPGIMDLLFPIKAKSAYQAQAIGSDVFKFLGNHGSGSISWDFKSAVKSALKMGQAISLEMKLCARPYMGFERFLLHWTPLKDEVGAVTWVILTLGNEQRA
ncbi:hypothetical protein LTS16_003208 [Friedmanniomyces endolithicus]|nr:hypothetical protein LTR35_014974 [Friedmanniomyces endolithicus]KAK0285327.1 hypothetical protein LTS00_010956 [Friedmanniomyces endolithicus]KAK0984232.1 hypothetical protein LTR54_014133 [Friedmanniomyces endolithicus]KAK1007480.1 hypothetical protein LTS01_002708 [Friedmanniomyces endolithicus]KAK1050224.1 hypothetical protein LTS16_003208 [Friedmanniomyces endolithicus]